MSSVGTHSHLGNCADQDFKPWSLRTLDPLSESTGRSRCLSLSSASSFSSLIVVILFTMIPILVEQLRRPSVPIRFQGNALTRFSSSGVFGHWILCPSPLEDPQKVAGHIHPSSRLEARTMDILNFAIFVSFSSCPTAIRSLTLTTFAVFRHSQPLSLLLHRRPMCFGRPATFTLYSS